MPAAIELEAIECYEDCQRASHTKAFVRSRVYQLICGSDSAVMYGPAYERACRIRNAMMLSTGKVDPFALCNILCNSTVDNLCDPSAFSYGIECRYRPVQWRQAALVPEVGEIDFADM